MRLVVTGREGQLAQSLIERGRSAGVEIICIARPEVDLLEPDVVARAIEAARGDVVINAAAYTAVDKAESEPELAMRVNGDGARAVAAAAAKTGRPVVQISTDYVFDGRLDRPYREEDPVAPTSAYGRSKLAGEYAAAAANPRCAIARTAWVYSPFGNNFVKTMLRLGLTRDEISVVADQWGAPTSALDIADALIAMSRRLVAEPGNESLFGAFHVTGLTYATWAEFAAAIFSAAAALGRPLVKVIPISTAQYPTPAARPANSRLDVGKLHRVFGLALPEWRGATQDCVQRLVRASETERRK
ncbi:dTDP-4-dehydrorhamnose reductase [Methylocapsa sp. S129]|uniref:dTDP-4-dehydrorhamnose reductase n=1 Tax=Methylocapsa sp. S129 TaxID=1641869 RepID=UPI00131D60DE|nr:dTDP-4-dehydrorhamnose reductase [Methylocapsa sp. S129]